jgi:hypothetical protein
MKESKKVCPDWAKTIRSGIKDFMFDNQDGKLTPEQVDYFRSLANEDVQFHKKMKASNEHIRKIIESIGS